jgi:hypothetical protein
MTVGKPWAFARGGHVKNTIKYASGPTPGNAQHLRRRPDDQLDAATGGRSPLRPGYKKGGVVAEKMQKTMHEFKHGALHSGSKTGPLVKNRDQAIAIGLNQARREGAKMRRGGHVKHHDEAGESAAEEARETAAQERAEGEGMKKGGKWIAGAIKHPGALHRTLGVPQGQKIPASKLAKAARSSNPTTRRRAALAKTLKSFHHAEGGPIRTVAKDMALQKVQSHERSMHGKVVTKAGGGLVSQYRRGGRSREC